ncbi:uncharacterized protein LOC127871584 [Dreissena polymorpha]|uniref:Uncharacterized protein n=1 Tax=Dreissena polymorpha TaxID=45954 RepID=A0A9D4LGM4_DREPO|nr:uncharacterized protein LOC127871584 [Dreissena polymorpha]KAH3858218.1 hypothetical protein DPMN_100838 [Dreissena polymorpha]
MDLKPSQIVYSQDSINNFFDKRSSHNGSRIGDTLDDVCEGRCPLSSIPKITVVNRDGKWVTADNRRLWVFRELERLGKCDTIPVRISTYIPEAKLTSYNGGTSVRVRGPAGGYWHNKPTPHKPKVQSTLQISNKATVYQSKYKVKDSSKCPTLFSYQAPKSKPQSSIPAHMTTATKTNVAMTVQTSPEHSPQLTIRSTSNSFRSNPLSSGLQPSYKAPVKISPISSSSSKYPSFSDIGKANDDYSKRHTHSSPSQYRDQRSYSTQVGSLGSQYGDQSNYSKNSELTVSQDRVPQSNYLTQGDSSGSQYRDQLSNYSKPGSPSRSTVSRSDSSVDHSSVRDIEHAPKSSEPRYVMPTYREGSRPNYGDSNKSCCGCTIL